MCKFIDRHGDTLCLVLGVACILAGYLALATQ